MTAEPGGARVPADPVAAELAAAVHRLRQYAATPHPAPDSLAQCVWLVLAEHDRRGRVEQAAVHLVRVASAGPDAPREDYQRAVTALIAAVRTNGEHRG